MRQLQLSILRILEQKETSFEELLQQLEQLDVQESELWAALAPLLDNETIEETAPQQFQVKEVAVAS